MLGLWGGPRGKFLGREDGGSAPVPRFRHLRNKSQFYAGFRAYRTLHYIYTHVTRIVERFNFNLINKQRLVHSRSAW